MYYNPPAERIDEIEVIKGAASLEYGPQTMGGVVNYTINRVITFRSRGAVAPQMARYALVSATSALLNAGGVALFTLHPQLAYTLGWWLARGAVYFAR